jgi:hypothetical protein
MENKDFLQVWDYILDNDELDLTDVLLLSKVLSLHTTKDGCYMSNDYICKMLRLKNIETASRRINKLEKMGYVELKYIPLPTNAKKTRRFIIPTYENGLILKSNRVDSKVNTPLTTKSTPLDSKVNTPLTQESTPPCPESQSIISVDYINENISEVHQLEHINELDNQILLEEQLEQVSIQLNLIKGIDKPDVNETRGQLTRQKYQIKNRLKELETQQ